jgi:hypothetical protein
MEWPTEEEMVEALDRVVNEAISCALKNRALKITWGRGEVRSREEFAAHVLADWMAGSYGIKAELLDRWQRERELDAPQY